MVPFTALLEKARVHAAWDDEPASVMPYGLHAELSGAIAGYCTAPRNYLGGHMIIDCGSATLDVASFALGSPSWPVGIYSARIEPLGADACITYLGHGVSSDVCRGAARFQEYQVFRETLPYMRVGVAQDRGKFPYQIILIGGGIHSEVHKPLFDRMEAVFHRAFHRPQLALFRCQASYSGRSGPKNW